MGGGQQNSVHGQECSAVCRAHENGAGFLKPGLLNLFLLLSHKHSEFSETAAENLPVVFLQCSCKFESPTCFQQSQPSEVSYTEHRLSAVT